MCNKVAAQFRIGYFLYNGVTGVRDLAQSFQWYMKAAKQDHKGGKNLPYKG